MAGVIERNNVHVRGAGDRTIVFAHGFGCDFKQRRDAGRTIVADWQLAERSRMPNPLANKKLGRSASGHRCCQRSLGEREADGRGLEPQTLHMLPGMRAIHDGWSLRGAVAVRPAFGES